MRRAFHEFRSAVIVAIIAAWFWAFSAVVAAVILFWLWRAAV